MAGGTRSLRGSRGLDTLVVGVAEPYAPVLAERPVSFKIFFFLEPGTVSWPLGRSQLGCTAQDDAPFWEPS